ncbi:MAG: alkaline phosphatase D family protein [Acidimicrobiales bacterium]
MVGRRGFLLGSGATLLLAACSSGDDNGTTAASTTTTPTSTTLHSARLSGDPFSLGVASGDPASDSVILWTRLAPAPLTPDGSGGMPDDLVDVRWQIATDDRFTAIVDEGIATADPQYGHSVHVDAGGLDAVADYFYRFTVGDFTSPVGRTRTLPAEDAAVSRLALAVANCQWYESGTYAAYRHMAEEDVDLVVHLGDYIYEYAAGTGRRQSAPGYEIESLADYRLRYASYKVDPDLQAAHHRFPFVATWDDHEVADNYLGDSVPEGEIPVERLPERRAAAYRAWWENLPSRLPAPDGDHADIYRELTFGDLARLEMLDERQYADVAPCRDEVADDFGDCAARTDEDRSRLGPDQEVWFTETVGRGGVTWDLIGNPVVLAGVDAGRSRSEFYLDTWDGFPDAQRRFIEAMAAADNPVVLTGDYHAGMVLDVNDAPFEPDAELVAPEFMAPPISSVLFPDDVSDRTPQLRQQINAHGYLTVVAEPDQLTATFRVLDDVQDARSAITTVATWQVDAGDPTPRQV